MPQQEEASTSNKFQVVKELKEDGPITRKWVPPIVPRKKGQLSKNLMDINIKFIKVKSINEGIQLPPAIVRYHQGIFDTKRLEYYTYQLHMDKVLKIVIHGILQEMDVEEVKADLIHRLGLLVISVTQIHRGPQKMPMLLNLVQLSRTEDAKAITKVTSLLYLWVTMEYRRKTGIGQCYCCHKFQHPQ